MTAPNPHAVLAYATAPHPFHDWDESPGTAADPDAITPAQYQARWLMRARSINPQFNVDVQQPKRRGRPKGSGHPQRPTKVIGGVLHLWCPKCEKFQPVTEFYRRLKAYQPVCRNHQECSGQQWRNARDKRQAALCEAEQEAT